VLAALSFLLVAAFSTNASAQHPLRAVRRDLVIASAIGLS